VNFKNKFNRIIKSKDGKVLMENFVSLSLLQVASYVFPLITLPYLARVIGVDKFGEIAFAGAVMVYFQTIVDWGFKFTATRDIAKNRNDKNKVSQIFSNVMWAEFFLMLLSLIIFVALILLVPKFWAMRKLMLISFCVVPCYMLFPDWLFQGLEKMKYITVMNVFSKLLFTIAIFIFIKQKSDFILQPLFTSLGFVLSGIMSMYIIVVKWKIKFTKPSVSEIIKTIKSSTDVFINTIAPNLYNSFSVLLLGFWGGSVANGKLDVGNKFVTVFQQLISVISRTFFPYLSRKIDKHALFAKINIITAGCVALLLFLFAPLLVKIFYTPEFSDGILVLRVMACSVLFLTISSVYGTNYLIVQGYEKQLRKITMVVSLMGFSMSIPLIYYFHFVGAAITITLTRGILGLSIMKCAVMIKNKKLIG
jgi:PST family polysaccharide transporter